VLFFEVKRVRKQKSTKVVAGYVDNFTYILGLMLLRFSLNVIGFTGDPTSKLNIYKPSFQRIKPFVDTTSDYTDIRFFTKLHK